MRGSSEEPRRRLEPLHPSWVGRARRTVARGSLVCGLVAAPIAGCGRFGYDELLAPIGEAGSGNGAQGGNGGAGGIASLDASVLPPGTGGAGGAAGSDGGANWDGGSAGSRVDSGSPPVPTPTCSDGVENGGESTVDCGGASCAPCPCALGAPELLGNPNLAGNDVLSLSLSADALTMFMAGQIQGASRPIATSTRPNRGNNFNFATTLPAPVNTSPAVEGTPFISRNNLVLIFFSERPGGAGDRDLYSSTRASTGAAFDSVVRLASVSSAQRDHAPWLSPDLLTLYFSSRRASANDDIWRATRATSGASFSAPTVVTELGSSGNEEGITLTDDGLVSYFASDRAGGFGGMDIYRAARARLTDPFSTPELVPGLNTSDDDTAPQLTADARELFFVSDRNGNNAQAFRISTLCP